MAKLNDKNFIFHQTQKDEDVRQVNYFTLIGENDFFDDQNRPRSNSENKHTVAKSVTVNNNPTRYYIKIGAYGKIYNPIGLYSEGKNTKFLSKIGKKEFEYTEVNQSVFDMYINFLTSKNIAWLNNAERELR
jgi:transcriptional regulator of NAD metabolism